MNPKSMLSFPIIRDITKEPLLWRARWFVDLPLIRVGMANFGLFGKICYSARRGLDAFDYPLRTSR